MHKRQYILMSTILLLFVVGMVACKKTPNEPQQKAEIMVTPSSISLAVGEESKPLEVVVSPKERTKEILWTSGNKAVAEINPATLKITAHRVGSTTIVARLLNKSGKEEATCGIEVTVHKEKDARYVVDLYFPEFSKIKEYETKINDAMSLFYEPYKTGKPHLDDSSWLYRKKEGSKAFFEDVQYLHTPPMGPPLLTCVAKVESVYTTEMAKERIAVYGFTKGVKEGVLGSKDAYNRDIPTIEAYNTQLGLKGFVFLEKIYEKKSETVDHVLMVLMVEDGAPKQ